MARGGGREEGKVTNTKAFLGKAMAKAFGYRHASRVERWQFTMSSRAPCKFCAESEREKGRERELHFSFVVASTHTEFK